MTYARHRVQHRRLVLAALMALGVAVGISAWRVAEHPGPVASAGRPVTLAAAEPGAPSFRVPTPQPSIATEPSSAKAREMAVDYEWTDGERPAIVWSKERDGWRITVDAAGVIMTARKLGPNEQLSQDDLARPDFLPGDLLREAGDYIGENLPLVGRDQGDHSGQ